MRIKFREGVWRGGPQPLITELPPAPGGAELTWDPQNPPRTPKTRSGFPQSQGKGELKLAGSSSLLP